MIHKNKVFLLLSLVFIFFNLTFFLSSDLHAQIENNFSFNRDLTLGSTGLDVMSLQIFLNRDLDTRLAVSGAGSPGQETKYFGSITKNAVIRFQEKYASEILTPLGLSRGTGYFGASTRAKIDSILDKEKHIFNQTEEIENKEIEQNFIEEEKESNSEKSDTLSLGGEMYTDELMLTQPSRYSGQRGEKLKLYGFGFTDNNTVYFGDTVELKNVKAKSYDTIEIDIPLDLELGYHEIKIENEKGKTAGSQVFFVVTDESSVEPRIDRVSPEKVSFGDEITIYGDGFDKSWNMVRTSFAVIEGIVSSDGKSLTFKVEPSYDETDLENHDFLSAEINEEINLVEFEESTGPWEEEVYFYVINDGGVSKTDSKFLFIH